jgi:hypothetical protein
MSFIYNIRKTTSLSLTFYKHKVNSYFFDEIKFVDHTIKIGYSYSLKLALYIYTLSFMLVSLLKAYLDPLGFIPSGGSTKFKTWLVHEAHSFKSFLGINIIYYF